MASCTLWNQFPTTIISEIANELDSKLAFDFGCGTGGNAIELGLADIPTVGIDQYKPAIKLAKSKLNNLHLDTDKFVIGATRMAQEVNDQRDPFLGVIFNQKNWDRFNKKGFWVKGDFHFQEEYVNQLPIEKEPDVDFRVGNIMYQYRTIKKEQPDFLYSVCTLVHLNESNMNLFLDSMLRATPLDSDVCLDYVLFSHESAVVKNNGRFAFVPRFEGKAGDLSKILSYMGFEENKDLSQKLGSTYSEVALDDNDISIGYLSRRPPPLQHYGYVGTKVEDTGIKFPEAIQKYLKEKEEKEAIAPPPTTKII